MYPIEYRQNILHFMYISPALSLIANAKEKPGRMYTFYGLN